MALRQSGRRLVIRTSTETTQTTAVLVLTSMTLSWTIFEVQYPHAGGACPACQGNTGSTGVAVATQRTTTHATKHARPPWVQQRSQKPHVVRQGDRGALPPIGIWAVSNRSVAFWPAHLTTQPRKSVESHLIVHVQNGRDVKLANGNAKMPTKQTSKCVDSRLLTNMRNGRHVKPFFVWHFGVLAVGAVANLPKCQPTSLLDKPPPCHRAERLACRMVWALAFWQFGKLM